MSKLCPHKTKFFPLEVTDTAITGPPPPAFQKELLLGQAPGTAQSV